MTIDHTIATAVLILGLTGTLAMLAYRLATQYADLRVVPVRLMARAHWWSHRTTSVLEASVLLLAVGIIGLVTT